MGVRGRVKSSKDWLPRRNPVSIPRLNRRSGPIASMYGIIERGQRTKNSLFPVLSRKKRRRGGAKRLTCQRYEVSRLIRRGRNKQRPNDGRGFLARKPLRGSSFLALSTIVCSRLTRKLVKAIFMPMIHGKTVISTARDIHDD